MTSIKHYIALCKIKIAALSTLSACTGFMLIGSRPDIAIIFTAAGIFLLACGAGSLNQYQEWTSDALMERTKSRPLPSGLIRPVNALFFSILAILSGLLLLHMTGSTTAIMLAAASVFWYNGVYTYLKRVTAFAAIPGALTGAVPPAIGWTAAGGELQDIRILAVCVFFFLWQVPHFWTFVLSHSNDYRKAGFPTIEHIFSNEQIERITSIWIIATAVTAMIIPLYIVSLHRLIYIMLFLISTWLAFCGIQLIRHRSSHFPAVFTKINLFMFLIMLVLAGEKLFSAI